MPTESFHSGLQVFFCTAACKKALTEAIGGPQLSSFLVIVLFNYFALEFMSNVFTQSLDIIIANILANICWCHVDDVAGKAHHLWLLIISLYPYPCIQLESQTVSYCLVIDS